jgi:hypothetical protein
MLGDDDDEELGEIKIMEMFEMPRLVLGGRRGL